MRTLTVIAEMGSGGAETVAADLACHLRATGRDTCVASSGGWRADQLIAGGVATLDVPLHDRSPAALARTVATLRRTVARRPVDVVHAHNVRATAAAWAGTVVGRRHPPSLVTTVHGLAEGDYARAVRLLGRSTLVVAVSDDVADRLRAAGIDPARLRVVENAVPPTPVAGPAERRAARSELRLPADEPVVLCIARLAPPKRVDLLLDAWAGIPGVLLVAGDGPDRPGLERRAAHLGDRVRLLGERRDVGRLLAGADLLVLPSDREGLPMVVLEAMAARVPVVASAVGGVPGLGRSAIELVPPGSAEALGTAIRIVLGDDLRRAGLVTAGAELAAGRFSAARMRAAYDAVYAEVERVERTE